MPSEVPSGRAAAEEDKENSRPAGAGPAKVGGGRGRAGASAAADSGDSAESAGASAAGPSSGGAADGDGEGADEPQESADMGSTVGADSLAELCRRVGLLAECAAGVGDVDAALRHLAETGARVTGAPDALQVLARRFVRICSASFPSQSAAAAAPAAPAESASSAAEPQRKRAGAKAAKGAAAVVATVEARPSGGQPSPPLFFELIRSVDPVLPAGALAAAATAELDAWASRAASGSAARCRLLADRAVALFDSRVHPVRRGRALGAAARLVRGGVAAGTAEDVYSFSAEAVALLCYARAVRVPQPLLLSCLSTHILSCSS